MHTFFSGDLCEKGWENPKDRCCLVVSSVQRYDVAKAECARVGATRAVVSDAEEHKFINDMGATHNL